MDKIIELHSCSIEKSTMSFPMGPLCIKTAINTSKTLPKAKLYMNYLSDDPCVEARRCARRNPSFVGIALYLWNMNWYKAFATELRKVLPTVTVFAGGPAVTAFENDFPPYLDFAIRGEGEVETVRLLTKALNGEEVRGLYHAEPVDLKTLPSVFLTHEADEVLKQTDSVLWEITRGCPYRCAFCFESRGNRLVRDFPFERVREELEYLIKHEIANVFVLDPTFNLDAKRAKRVLNLILEICPPWMHFTFEVRAELIDEELAQLFALVNCSLQIGLQSSDENVIKNINRHFDPKEFKEHVGLLEKSGAAYGCDIIIGLPGDTLEKFKKTVDFTVALKPSNIDCFVLCLLPDTELSYREKELGYTVKDDLEKTIISSPTFSESDMRTALEIKNAMDLFYTKGQACMWLHCVLETLNISACNLFSLFSKWMRQTERNEDEDIWILQDDFVTSLFEKTQNTKLLPAMKSFMELHQGICYVTDTAEPVELELSYTPDELSLLDSISLSEFVKSHRMRRNCPTIDLDEDGLICFR